MTHPPVQTHRRLDGGAARAGKMVTSLSGLAAFMAIAIGLAPAASAINVPPPGISGATVAPPPPPSPSQVTTVPAHFPLWAIVTVIAATVVLSVATTLITLSLAHLRRVRRAPAPAPAPAGAPIPTATPESEAEAAQDGALTGSPYAARQRRAPSRQLVTESRAAAAARDRDPGSPRPVTIRYLGKNHHCVLPISSGPRLQANGVDGMENPAIWQRNPQQAEHRPARL